MSIAPFPIPLAPLSKISSQVGAHLFLCVSNQMTLWHCMHLHRKVQRVGGLDQQGFNGTHTHPIFKGFSQTV